MALRLAGVSMTLGSSVATVAPGGSPPSLPTLPAMELTARNERVRSATNVPKHAAARIFF